MLIERPAHLSYIGLATVTLAVAAIVAGLIAASRYTPHVLDIPLPKATISGATVPASLVDQNGRIESKLGEARRARTDMLLHAIEHGMAVEAEEAFGTMADFDDAWNLYYADVLTAEGRVTLYTAVSKDEPRIRYTAAWDAANGWASPWEPVLW